MTRWPQAAALRAAFVAASVAWMALLIVAPWLASRAHASTFGTLLAAGVYAAGSLVCHQLPERSYRLWTAQMPVCARCAGIYLGAAVSAVCAAIYRSPVRHARLILALAVFPTLVTLVYEWTSGDMPAHAIRALAGVPIGAAAAWLAVSAADNQVN